MSAERSQSEFIFRRANIEDIKYVLEMIQELADFEKMSDGPKLTKQDLIRDAGLNGDPEYCHIYILELQTNDQDKISTLPIGYAICFFSYSTWEGKSYFLEDIYVKPKYRGHGAGARLFREVASKAKEYNCKRVDFHVLKWNTACGFYKRMGAIDLTEKEEWQFYRLHKEQIDNLAKQLNI